jgi:uncharacterized membrane-anchored protein
MKYPLRLAVVVALQTLALVAMVAMKQWTLQTGVPVLLETEPVDPRSLFRGDYVTLSYAISNLEQGALAGDDDFERHDPVHVLLREDTPYWQPVSLHRERPEVPPGQVAIKGEVLYSSHMVDGARSTTVRYGIENYFVPEGEGRALERPEEDEEVSILVAVDRYGNAGIKAVLVNGEVHYEERLF